MKCDSTSKCGSFFSLTLETKGTAETVLTFFLALLPFSVCDQLALPSRGCMSLLAWLAEQISYVSGQLFLFSNASLLRFDPCICLLPPQISKITGNIGKKAGLWVMLARRDETMPGSGYSTQNSPPQLARTGMTAACARRDASAEWSTESKQFLFHLRWDLFASTCM